MMENVDDEEYFQDIFDSTVGNSGRTCDLLDNPYVRPHPHQGEGDRIDYILYRSRHGSFEEKSFLSSIVFL